MFNMFKFLCTFAIVGNVSSVRKQNIDDVAVPMSSSTTRSPGSLWRYEDESSWPGRACKEGGPRQSPIDIRTASVVTDFRKKFIKHGKLVFKGYNNVLVSGLNNGHTIQFMTDGGETIHPTLTGGPLNHTYRLEQLHFHWLSEHSVDGFKYPMEIHFVHIRTDLSVAKALQDKEGLAIIAVFCNVMPDSENEEQGTNAMNEVMQHVPRLSRFGSRVSGVLLNMLQLLPTNPQSYVTYSGSLTSPECNEVVTWIIMEKPVFMSDVQYQQLSDVSVSKYNFRSLRLTNQTVYRPSVPVFYTPFLVKMAKTVVDMVSGFFRNVTDMLEQSKEAM